MRVLLLLLLCACASPEAKLSPVLPSSATTTASVGAALSIPSTASAPASLPASVATKGTIIARLVDGERPILACGIAAYIGVYVYEIESVETGEALSGRLVVDVLCPDFLLGKVSFKVGQRHRIILDTAKKTYAGATPTKPPQSGLPRFSHQGIMPAAP